MCVRGGGGGGVEGEVLLLKQKLQKVGGWGWGEILSKTETTKGVCVGGGGGKRGEARSKAETMKG